MSYTDSEKIDLMGGTGAVAAACDIKAPSVSAWRKKGIPPARRQKFELTHPELFPPRKRSADE